MSARAPYTSDEDSLLVKYIARYNPTERGRAGNALYKTLCEDADNKWKWSRTHPWQSWRDRYYKNQEYFDKKIKAYQKKHGISDEKSAKLKKVGGDGSSADEGGEYEEGSVAGKRKRRLIDEEKRAKPKREPEESQGHKVSNGKKQETFVKGKGRPPTDRRDEGDRSKASSARRPRSLDEDQNKNWGSKDDVEHGVVDEQGTSRLAERADPIEQAQTGQSAPQSLYPDITTLPPPQLQQHVLHAPKDPSVPGGHNDELPSTAPVVCRHRPVDPQPEASSSKVQLSPSHRIPRNPPTTTPLPRRKHQSEDDFFAPLPQTHSPPGQSEKAYTKHRRPKLTEDPFGGHSFGRRNGVVDEDGSSDGAGKAKVWPPSRKRNSSLKDKGKAREMAKSDEGRTGNIAAVQKTSKTLDESHGQSRIRADAPPAARQPVLLNGRMSHSYVAQTGQNRSSTTHGRIEQPRLRSPPKIFKPSIDRIKLTGSSPSLQGPFRLSHSSSGTTIAAQSARNRSESIPSTSRVRAEQPVRLPSPSRIFEPQKVPPAKQANGKSVSLQGSSRLSRSASGAIIPVQSEANSTGGKKTMLPRSSWTPGDPFIAHPIHDGSDLDSATRAQSLVTRRHTIGNTHEAQNTSGRRVDLRAVMAKRLLHDRSSSAIHSRAHSVATTVSVTSPSIADPTLPTARRRSSLLPIPVAEEDRERIEFLGVSRAVELIADNFGFRNEDVWRAWEVFKNISRTEDFFRRFREKAPSIQDAVLADMERDGVDLEALLVEQEEDGAKSWPEPEPEPESEHRPHQERERDGHPAHALNTGTGRSPNRRMQERDLKIKPLPLERALSEYTPPYMSRAGQYVRLVKQGRKEEALSREKRRASGGSGVFPRLKSEPGTQEMPQSPISDAREGEGSDGKRAEMEEGADSDLDQPSGEADDDAVEEGPLREEEEVAFLSASAEDAVKLRLIEQRVDVNDMLRWTASCLARVRNGVSPPSPPQP